MDKYRLEIVRYGFEVIGGQPKIVIHQVKVLDENGKYVKFSKLKEVEPWLGKLPTRFKIK